MQAYVRAWINVSFAERIKKQGVNARVMRVSATRGKGKGNNMQV
jgi:hypothetical protein